MISECLKRLREEKGLNMRQVALELEMPYTTYVGYEKGEREPGSEALIKLANFYECSIDYLIGCTDKKNIITNVVYDTKKDSPDEWESLKSELMQLSDESVDELHKYVKYLLWLEEQN